MAHSKNTAENTEAEITTSGWMPNCQTDTATAGSSAMMTRSIRRRVSVLVRTWGW